MTAGISAQRAQDENLRVFGRAALPRRPRIQGRAAALPYQDGEDFCPAPPAQTDGFSFADRRRRVNLALPCPMV